MQKLNRHLNSSDLCAFTRQLAIMQHAGIPLASALKIIKDSGVKTTMVSLANTIKKQLESGRSLAETLRANPRQFDNLYCSLIETGEAAGKLALILDRIANYLEKIEHLKRKIKKATYYPCAVIAIALIVMLILLIKVVPVFKTMFDGFNAELPAFTRKILDLSATVQNHWLMLAILTSAIVWLCCKLYREHPNFKTHIQRAALRLPILGKILHKIAVAQFTRTMATTVAAGLPLPHALLLCAKTNTNNVYVLAVIRMRSLIMQGEAISSAMHSIQLFPPLVTQMINVGEQSGSLESVLLKIAEIYENEVDLSIDGLTTLLEPLIMLVLGIIVGGLVLAMYLPIFKLGTVF